MPSGGSHRIQSFRALHCAHRTVGRPFCIRGCAVDQCSVSDLCGIGCGADRCGADVRWTGTVRWCAGAGDDRLAPAAGQPASRVRWSVPSMWVGCCLGGVGGCELRRECTFVCLRWGLACVGVATAAVSAAGVHCCAPWAELGAFGAGRVVINHVEGARRCAFGGVCVCWGWCWWCYLLPRVCWRAPSMRVGILWGWLGGGKSCRGCTVVCPWHGMVRVKAMLAVVFVVEGAVACTLDAGWVPFWCCG